MRIRTVRWAVLALILTASISSFAGVFISVGFGPPPLPVYVQPPCPAVGYIWTPGYWAYGPNGYFWVPGTWVLAPQAGLLWTPGYWGWGGAAFIWHAGYWGPRVGFYGGINYGFGYTGVGYAGGYWRNGAFFYNRSVNNINVTRITNVYNTTVINNVNRVSFNGGQGGITARPTATEMAVAREKHFGPTSLQARQQTMAASNRQLWASENHGRPAIAATARPGVFTGNGVVAAREAGRPNSTPASRGVSEPRAATAVPRPGNGVARPMTAERNVNNVPRPPRPQAGSAGPRPRTADRPSVTTGRATVPRPSADARNNARNQNAPRMENPSRENMPRGQAANRVQSPRTEGVSRPEPRENEHGGGELRGAEGHSKGSRR